MDLKIGQTWVQVLALPPSSYNLGCCMPPRAPVFIPTPWEQCPLIGPFWRPSEVAKEAGEALHSRQLSSFLPPLPDTCPYPLSGSSTNI